MLIYANDYEDKLPRAGGPASRWSGRIPDWMGPDRCGAFGVTKGDNTGGQVSISASLYMLVKYAEMRPESFLCKGDKGVTSFRPSLYGAGKKQLTELWDFGPNPPLHVSYAYHMMYGPYELGVQGAPGFAVASDRNPWMNSPFARRKSFSRFKPDIPPFNGSTDEGRYGNTVAHKGDGQNVLFLDSHVEFALRSSCSVDDDNIYTSWDGQDKVRGTAPVLGSQPADPNDSLLVNDPAVSRP
jgi:hypothetical protein